MWIRQVIVPGYTDKEEDLLKLKEKDLQVKAHLEEMSEITRHLSYNDINLLKRNTEGKHKEKEENQEER